MIESGPHITITKQAAKYQKPVLDFQITDWRVYEPQEVYDAGARGLHVSKNQQWYWVILGVDNTVFVKGNTVHPPHMSIAGVN